MKSKDKKRILLALEDGVKIYYPSNIYEKRTGVDLLDFMNEIKSENEELNIIFYREDKLGYWRVCNE